MLLKKIDSYGIRGNANALIGDYLSNRNQKVDIDDMMSDTTTNFNQFSLPQGSNLGPLMFLLFINGIFKLNLNGTLILFADDAVLIYFDTIIETLQTKTQDDLDKIEKWLNANRLTPNTEKTNYMLIKQGASIDANFTINFANKTLNRVALVKYLGITIQENLKWNSHIQSTCRKIIGFSSIVKRLGNRINPSTKMSMYYSMIHSHLSYLSPIWNTTATNYEIANLQIAQNEAIRKIFCHEYTHENLSTDDIRKKYSILNVARVNQFNNSLMIYKIINARMKTNYCINNANTHRYPTTANSRPRFATARTNLGQKSIFRSCTEQYYALLNVLPTGLSMNNFKKRLKSLIISRES